MGLIFRTPTQTTSRAELRRAAYAILLSAAVVAIAIKAIFLTTEPEIVSLLVEPFSLLLLPGLILSFVMAGPHEYSPKIVITASLACYTVIIYFGLGWLSRRRGVR